MPSVCILQVCVTVNYIKSECCTENLLWRIYVAGNNETYLGVHVRCLIYVSNFSWIRIFSADFHEIPSQRHVLWKSIVWKPP